MWGGLSFQDSCSYVMEQLIYFHDHCLVILFFVSYLVLYFVFLGAISDFYDKGVREGHEIEFIWTLLPASFLIAVALPSLKILYLIDEDFGKSLTYKITGHQWYWSYEYSDYVGYREDGFISSREIFRLFTTEERLLVPFLVPLRILVTSQDVIHSWVIPSIGVKCDALPGRLNQLVFILGRSGLFFGQCSELCGANHSFIPISIERNEGVSYLDYFNMS